MHVLYLFYTPDIPPLSRLQALVFGRLADDDDAGGRPPKSRLTSKQTGQLVGVGGIVGQRKLLVTAAEVKDNVRAWMCRVELGMEELLTMINIIRHLIGSDGAMAG